MQVITTQRKPIKMWATDPEPQAVEQLKKLADMPFIFKHVAAMPDMHFGKGSTVGSVIATQGAIIPAAVGVDIGCGMLAYNTNLYAKDLRPFAAELRKAIEAVVPVGFKGWEEQLLGSKAWDGWGRMTDALGERFVETVGSKKARLQHGTLGGGNHFIELCEDERGFAWVMLHSGSRGIGKMIADVHMGMARILCGKRFIDLADPDLAYLVEGDESFNEYIKAVTWCQQYAWTNRELMLMQVCHALELAGFTPTEGGTLVHVHHNYTTKENHFGQNVWVTRKGAVCARKGDLVVIPGSMGTRSYIAEGLGNPESFNSCSHGAGRRMGRNEARRQFTVEDLARQTEGVECRKDDGVLDELPGAYKDIELVMADQADLVKPLHILKQFLCIKG